VEVNNIMVNRSKGLVLLLLLVVSFISAQENYSGRTLIMGWEFAEDDTSLQTNIAIDAITGYAEAAKYQMYSSEKYNPSCKIELYRVYKDDYYDDGEHFETARVYVYINSNVLNNDHFDYHNRYIEINFYIIYNGKPLKYMLILYYNNYNWIENYNEEDYKLVATGDNAYYFFISEIEKLKR
jgi:hypothetical protein